MGQVPLPKGISVVVPTSSDEQAPYLENCLRSLSAQRGYDGPVEIVVVRLHDGSQALGLADCCARQQVRLLHHHNPHPHFSGALARNIGARAARQPVLLFVDADIVLPTDTLVLGTQELAAADAAVMLVARMKQRPAHEIYRKLEPGVFAKNAATGKVDVHGYSAVFFIRRSLFTTIRGFDEKFVGWGGEDTDMVYRLRNNGKRIISITMRHKVMAMHQWHAPRPWYRRPAVRRRNQQKIRDGGPLIRNRGGWGGRSD